MPARRNWDDAARVIWPLLTAAAADRRLPFYQELAPHIKTNPLSVGRALGPIQTYCLENRLPPLTAIVVGKTTGVPGEGFVAWDIEDIASAISQVFDKDWSRVDNPFSGFSEGVTEASLAQRLLIDPNKSIEVYSLVKNRGVAQRIFRRALLEAYDYECCFCKISFDQLLQAAHIVAWSECGPEERIDVRNGLLLCANHHKMFDAGIISVRPDLMIEFCDPEELQGAYSSADSGASSSLHRQRIHVPAQADHRPNPQFLRRRRITDNW